MWTSIFQFIGLLPEFWKQFKAWQAYGEEVSYQQYVERRERVIKQISEVNDAKTAFEAALSAQRLLRAGR